MNINKVLLGALGAVLAAAVALMGLLYKGEAEKNRLLRAEGQKTVLEAQAELKKGKEELARERDKGLADAQKLVEQMNEAIRERDRAVAETEGLRQRVLKEREVTLVTNEDMNSLRNEIDKLRTEGRAEVADLEKSYKKKLQTYDTRILSLEAALEKARKRLSAEAERYHYNLGVLHTQNKDYDLAVKEFRTTLGYNPKNTQAHYNLGIIYDDYFKDRQNARTHYRSFLELDPTSDDAESVQEWLADIEK